MKKNEKGITLITLATTIVVLMILSTVSINAVFGENGILKKSKQQRAKTEGTIYNEETKNNEISTEYANAMNSEYIKISEAIKEQKLMSEKAKPGDYVIYSSPSKSFTMSTSQTGYSSSQTYSTDSYIGMWQVLYNDTVHGLQIISCGDVTAGKGFYLGNSSDETNAKLSYNNAVTTLNMFAQNYVNTTYATSGRCVGSNPTKPADSVNTNLTLTSAFNGSTDSGCKIADTNYTIDLNALTNATSQKSAGIASIGSEYFLASRNAWAGNNTGFAIRTISSSGSLSCTTSLLSYDIIGGSTLKSSDKAGVRPVITLKDDVRISSGNGSNTNPYTLTVRNFSFAYTGSLQTLTIPDDGVYSFEFAGASGSGGNTYGQTSLTAAGGKGAKIVAKFRLNQGDIIDIVVGGQGTCTQATAADGTSGGGGGGTFAFKRIDTITDSKYQFTKGSINYETLLAVAGGGGSQDVGYKKVNSTGYNGQAASYKSPNNYTAYSTTTNAGTSSASVSGTMGISQFISYDLKGSFYTRNSGRAQGGYGGGGSQDDNYSYGGGWCNGSNTCQAMSWSLDTTATGTDGANTGNGYAKITWLNY